MPDKDPIIPINSQWEIFFPGSPTGKWSSRDVIDPEYFPKKTMEGNFETLLFLPIIIALVLATRAAYRFFLAERFEPDPVRALENSIPATPFNAQALVYEGRNLNFKDEVMLTILQKRFPYFNTLDNPDKEKFLFRLRRFMEDKVFSIHDDKGFREMPILISACAIQLTFGLEKFLLPFFKYIHIYPAEFIGTWPTIRYLMGNVSGNTINIGWKYFLYDIEHPADGKNLGLHEMSHALYYQTFEVEEHVDRDFKKTFYEFTTVGDKVYTRSEINLDGLYSPYAMKNFQEFWAESVELFFERPLDMRRKYNELYYAIADLFNQDPAARKLMPH